MLSKRAVAIGIIGVSLGLHIVIRNNVLSWMPLPIVLAGVVTFCAHRPVRYLAALAIVSELFTTFPLGVMTLVVILPYLIRRYAWAVLADLSFSFWLAAAGSVLAQLLVMVISEALTAGVWEVPVGRIGLVTVASSLAVFAFSVAWSEYFPVYER